MLPSEQLVIVFNGKSGTVVTANGDIELGIMGPNDRIKLEMRITPNGPVYDILRNNVAVG
jgi:hypothetical protein